MARSKSTFCLLFVAAFALTSLAACGSSDGGDDDDDVPTRPDATPDAGAVPAFGDACTCPTPPGNGSGSYFECSGTDICAAGLRCVGQTFGGISTGVCRGPVCCTGADDCAANLGGGARCGANQQCRCPFGDLECFGTECTCEGGAPATHGLCYPNPG